MASDLDFSPPEVPEPTFLENLLRYGLFLGAIFQLICVLAIIVPLPKSHEAGENQPSCLPIETRFISDFLGQKIICLAPDDGKAFEKQRNVFPVVLVSRFFAISL
ncbi:Protein MANBAL [Galemys pyrenaicus]|uniref:Protein MANBAL n=1 Tax=Galemys pyrenaicus TaxID=202257 RepID=A0A8J6ABV3_GALPY|nr:Protein MANBAL [Galemys pyrenaicus]